MEVQSVIQKKYFFEFTIKKKDSPKTGALVCISEDTDSGLQSTQSSDRLAAGDSNRGLSVKIKKNMYLDFSW